MEKFESRIGKLKASEENVFLFLADFNNFKQFIPGDQISNWQSDQETCSFTIGGVGDVSLRIIEKEPYKLIKINGGGMAKVEFFLWIQLKQLEEKDTRVKITLKADLNPMIKMVAAKPLKQFLEILVGHMENFAFEEGSTGN